MRQKDETKHLRILEKFVQSRLCFTEGNGFHQAILLSGPMMAKPKAFLLHAWLISSVRDR